MEPRQNGQIVRLSLTNFMTYAQLSDVKFSGSVQLIIGNNGSGKSTILCALVLGLAGEPSVTGRGNSPADFVKRGTDSGTTEIELYNSKGNYVIKRKISIIGRNQNKIDHKSEWWINGKVVTKAEVQKLTDKLNIKVDNLCQFLPQDSVTQFVKMNTFELLSNTLKATGDNSLVEDHQKLIEYSRDYDDKNQELRVLQQACKENEVNAQRLENEVRELRERQALVKQKFICGQKIEFVKYLNVKTKCDEARAERNRLKDQLTKIESTHDPHRQATERFKNESSKYKDCIEATEGTLSSLSNSIQKTSQDLENRKLQCQEEFAKFKSIEKEKQERERVIALKHQELRNTQIEFDKIKDVDYTRELAEATKLMNEAKEEWKKNRDAQYRLKANIDNYLSAMNQLKAKIEDMVKIRARKDALLKQNSRESAMVLEWLSKNTACFKGKIYSPIMCELNLKDQKYSNIVENAIPRQELLSFVCTNEDDLKLFTRSVRDQLKVKFNVILAPVKSKQDFEEEAARCNPLQLGTFLIDLIEAPDPILNYLCASLNFHRIPVVEECDEIRMRKITEAYPKAYIGQQFHHTTRSRYDNQIMTVSEVVRNAHLLTIALDTSEFNRLNNEYKDKQNKRDLEQVEYNRVLQEDDKLKSNWNQISGSVQDIRMKHDKKANLAKAIEMSKEHIARLENDRIDVEAARAELQKAIGIISKNIMAKLKRLTEIYQEYGEVKGNHMLNLLVAVQAKRNHKLAFRRLEAAKRDSHKLKETLIQKAEELEDLKRQLTVNENLAAEKIPNFNGGKLDSKTKKNFALIEANTLDDLRIKFEELSAKIQRIYKDPNNTVMNEFTRQTRQLQEKRVRIGELEDEIRMTEGLRDNIKSKWLPKLNSVIEVIDKNYKEFMQSLSYDGQVRLDFDNSKANDFSNYGIMILVKYRDNEQLIPLSSTRQSGGERSVATMIYMLALQSRTTVPFRCVDEINQGMDQVNERKVFELLVKTADSSSSQYFLVSPKLLSNLPYSPKMKIHIVFSGKKLHLKWKENE